MGRADAIQLLLRRGIEVCPECELSWNEGSQVPVQDLECGHFKCATCYRFPTEPGALCGQCKCPECGKPYMELTRTIIMDYSCGHKKCKVCFVSQALNNTECEQCADEAHESEDDDGLIVEASKGLSSPVSFHPPPPAEESDSNDSVDTSASTIVSSEDFDGVEDAASSTGIAEVPLPPAAHHTESNILLKSTRQQLPVPHVSLPVRAPSPQPLTKSPSAATLTASSQFFYHRAQLSNATPQRSINSAEVRNLFGPKAKQPDQLQAQTPKLVHLPQPKVNLIPVVKVYPQHRRPSLEVAQVPVAVGVIAGEDRIRPASPTTPQTTACTAPAQEIPTIPSSAFSSFSSSFGSSCSLLETLEAHSKNILDEACKTSEKSPRSSTPVRDDWAFDMNLLINKNCESKKEYPTGTKIATAGSAEITPPSTEKDAHPIQLSLREPVINGDAETRPEPSAVQYHHVVNNGADQVGNQIPIQMPTHSPLHPKAVLLTSPSKRVGRPREEKPFGCTECGKRFATLQTLEYHSIFHPVCEYCHKRFKNPDFLRKHEELMHW